MCQFRHTWINDVGEDIYIRKLEKTNKYLSTDSFNTILHV